MKLKTVRYAGAGNRKTILLSIVFLCAIATAKAQENTQQHIKVSAITVTGNKRTKVAVINRELLVSKDSLYSIDEFPQKINQSRLNLLNTGLFNFVTIDTIFKTLDTATDFEVQLNISLLERWYVWPVPILEITDRNFNSWWQKRDFTRINYGFDTRWENISGHLDDFHLILQAGKNREAGIAYFLPYINKRKTLGINIEGGFKNNREIGANTINDKLIYLFDTKYLLDAWYAGGGITLRRNIFTTHYLTATYNKVKMDDTLTAYNPDFSYPHANKLNYISLYYKLKCDHRDIKYYPLQGWYADLELSKNGIGLAFEKPVNIFWAKTTLRFYYPFGNRFYSGISFIGKISSEAWQPYLLLQGLGYGREYVRGYQYKVIDGKHFAVFRSNIKYALVPEKQHNIGIIPSQRFSRIHYAIYLTAFADAGYVSNPQSNQNNGNTLPNTWLTGTGAGIDFVTYYDKVIRIEYAINKQKQGGLFVHFIAGI